MPSDRDGEPKSKKRRRHERKAVDQDALRKLLKYAAQGRTSKVKHLVKRSAPLAQAHHGSKETTALHEACRHGHSEVAALLLRHGADAGAADAAGNSPAHLAAMYGHLPLLMQLLQSGAPPDVDANNLEGVTVRQLTDSAMARGELQQRQQQQQQQLAGSRAGAEVQAGDRQSPGDDPDAEWRARLQQEMSDDEAGGVGYARYGSAGEGDAAWWAEVEPDGEWADRIWAQMQARRRAAAAAAVSAACGGGGGGAAADAARRSAAARRVERAAEAAAASARILGAEQAKDAAWRQRMLAQVQQHSQAALPARRTAYEAAWAALDAAGASAPLSYAAIPWPVPDAAADPEGCDAVLLQGVGDAGELRERVRLELRRWHPDKFEARFRARLLGAGDAQRVLAGVKAVAQRLTGLMAGGARGA